MSDPNLSPETKTPCLPRLSPNAMDHDMNSDSPFGLAPAFDQLQPPQQSQFQIDPTRKQLSVISFQFSSFLTQKKISNQTETWFSFKIAPVAKAHTSHQQQGTSRPSVRTSSSQVGSRAKRTCASASLPFAITHPKTTRISPGILAFRLISARSSDICLLCTRVVEGMGPRPSLLRLRTC